MAPLSFPRLRLSSRSSPGKTPATAGGRRSTSSNDPCRKGVRNSEVSEDEQVEDTAAVAHVAPISYTAETTPSIVAAGWATATKDNQSDAAAIALRPPRALCAPSVTAAHSTSKDKSGTSPMPDHEGDSEESALLPKAPVCASPQQQQQQPQRWQQPLQQNEESTRERCQMEQQQQQRQHRQKQQQQQQQRRQQHISRHDKEHPQRPDVLLPASQAVSGAEANVATPTEAAEQQQRLCQRSTVPAMDSSRMATLSGRAMCSPRNALDPSEVALAGARTTPSSPPKRRLAAAARALLSPQGQSQPQQQHGEGRGNGTRGKSSLIEHLLFRKKEKRLSCGADNAATVLSGGDRGDSGEELNSEALERHTQIEYEDDIAPVGSPVHSAAAKTSAHTAGETSTEKDFGAEEETAALPEKAVRAAATRGATSAEEEGLCSPWGEPPHSDNISADARNQQGPTQEQLVKEELLLQLQTDDCCTPEYAWSVAGAVREDAAACKCLPGAHTVALGEGPPSSSLNKATSSAEEGAAVEGEKEEGAAGEGHCESDLQATAAVAACGVAGEAAADVSACATATSPRHGEDTGDIAAARHVIERGECASAGAVSAAPQSGRVAGSSPPRPGASDKSYRRRSSSSSRGRDNDSLTNSSSRRCSLRSNSSIYTHASGLQKEQQQQQHAEEETARASSTNSAVLEQQQSGLWEVSGKQQRDLQHHLVRALQQQDRQRQEQEQQGVEEMQQQLHLQPKQQQGGEGGGEQQCQGQQSLGQKEGQHQRRCKSAEEELLQYSSDGVGAFSSAQPAAAASSCTASWRDRSSSRNRCSSSSSTPRSVCHRASSHRIQRVERAAVYAKDCLNGTNTTASASGSAAAVADLASGRTGFDAAAAAAVGGGGGGAAAGAAAGTAGEEAVRCATTTNEGITNEARQERDNKQKFWRLPLFALRLSDGCAFPQSARSQAAALRVQQRRQQQCGRPEADVTATGAAAAAAQTASAQADAATALIERLGGAAAAARGVEDAAPSTARSSPAAESNHPHRLGDSGMCVFVREVRALHRASTDTRLPRRHHFAHEEEDSCCSSRVGGREQLHLHQPFWHELRCDGCLRSSQGPSCCTRKSSCSTRSGCSSSDCCSNGATTKGSTSSSTAGSSYRTDSGSSLGSDDTGSLHCSSSSERERRASSEDCSSDASGKTLSTSRKPSTEVEDASDIALCVTAVVRRRSSSRSRSDGADSKTHSRREFHRVESLASLPCCSGRPVSSATVAGAVSEGLAQADVRQLVPRQLQQQGQGGEQQLRSGDQEREDQPQQPPQQQLQVQQTQRQLQTQREHQMQRQQQMQRQEQTRRQQQTQRGQQLQQPQQQQQPQQPQQTQQQRQTQQQQHTQQQKKLPPEYPSARRRSVTASSGSGPAVLPIASPRTRPKGILPSRRDTQQSLSENPAASVAAARPGGRHRQALPAAAPAAPSSSTVCDGGNSKEGGGAQAAATAADRARKASSQSAVAAPVAAEVVNACPGADPDGELRLMEKGGAASAAPGALYTVSVSSTGQDIAADTRHSATNVQRGAQKTSTPTAHADSKRGVAVAAARRPSAVAVAVSATAAEYLTMKCAAGRTATEHAYAAASAPAAEEGPVSSSCAGGQPPASDVNTNKIATKATNLEDDTDSGEACGAQRGFPAQEGAVVGASHRRSSKRAVRRRPPAAVAPAAAAARRRARPAHGGKAFLEASGGIVEGPQRGDGRGGGRGSAAAGGCRRVAAGERQACIVSKGSGRLQEKATEGGSRDNSRAVRLSATVAQARPPRLVQSEKEEAAAAAGLSTSRSFAEEDPWSSTFALSDSSRSQQYHTKGRRTTREKVLSRHCGRECNTEEVARGGEEDVAGGEQERNIVYHWNRGGGHLHSRGEATSLQQEAELQRKDTERRKGKAPHVEGNTTTCFMAPGEAAAAEKKARTAAAGAWEEMEEKEEEYVAADGEDEEEQRDGEAGAEMAAPEEEGSLKKEEKEQCWSDSCMTAGDASSVVVYETDDDAVPSSSSAGSFNSHSEESSGERSRRSSDSSKGDIRTSRRSSDSALCSSSCVTCSSRPKGSLESHSLATAAAAAAARTKESATSASFFAAAADTFHEPPPTDNVQAAAAAESEAAATQKEKAAGERAATTPTEGHTGAATTTAAAPVEQEEEEEEEEQQQTEGVHEREEFSEASHAEAELREASGKRAAAEAKDSGLSTSHVEDDEAQNEFVDPTLTAAAAAATRGANEADKESRRLLSEIAVGDLWLNGATCGHPRQGPCTFAAAPWTWSTSRTCSLAAAAAAASSAAGGAHSDVVESADGVSLAAEGITSLESFKTVTCSKGCCSSDKGKIKTKELPLAAVAAEEIAEGTATDEQEQIGRDVVAGALTSSPGHCNLRAEAATSAGDVEEQKVSDAAVGVTAAAAATVVQHTDARDTRATLSKEKSKCAECGLLFPLDELADHLLAHALAESPRATSRQLMPAAPPAAAGRGLHCDEIQQRQQEQQLHELGQQVYYWPTGWLQRHQSCTGAFEHCEHRQQSLWGWSSPVTLEAQHHTSSSAESPQQQQQHAAGELVLQQEKEDEDSQQQQVSVPSTTHHQPQHTTGAAAVASVTRTNCFLDSPVAPVGVVTPSGNNTGMAGDRPAASVGAPSAVERRAAAENEEALYWKLWPMGLRKSSSQEDAAAAGEDSPVAAAEVAPAVITPAVRSATQLQEKQQQQQQAANAGEILPAALAEEEKGVDEETEAQQQHEKKQKLMQAAAVERADGDSTAAAVTAEAPARRIVATAAPATRHGSPASELRRNDASGAADTRPHWRGRCVKSLPVRGAGFHTSDGAAAAAIARMVRSRSAPEEGRVAPYVEVAGVSNCSTCKRKTTVCAAMAAEGKTATPGHRHEHSAECEVGGAPGAPAELPAESDAAETAAAGDAAARASDGRALNEGERLVAETEPTEKGDGEAPHEGLEAGAAEKPQTATEPIETAREEAATAAEEDCEYACWTQATVQYSSRCYGHSADTSRRRSSDQQRAKTESERESCSNSSCIAAGTVGGCSSTLLASEEQTRSRGSTASSLTPAATAAGSNADEPPVRFLSSGSRSSNRRRDSGGSSDATPTSRNRTRGGKSSNGETMHRGGTAVSTSTSVDDTQQQNSGGSRDSRSGSVHPKSNEGAVGDSSSASSRYSSLASRRSPSNNRGSRSTKSSRHSSADKKESQKSGSRKPATAKAQQHGRGNHLLQPQPSATGTCEGRDCAVTEGSFIGGDPGTRGALPLRSAASSRSIAVDSSSSGRPRPVAREEENDESPRRSYGHPCRSSEVRSVNACTSCVESSSLEAHPPQTCCCSSYCQCCASTVHCCCSATAGGSAAATPLADSHRGQYVARVLGEPPQHNSRQHSNSCRNTANNGSNPCSSISGQDATHHHGNSRNTAVVRSSQGGTAGTSSGTEGYDEVIAIGSEGLLLHRNGSSSSESCSGSRDVSDGSSNACSIEDSRTDSCSGSGRRTTARGSREKRTAGTLRKIEERNSSTGRSEKQQQRSSDLQRHEDKASADLQQQGTEREVASLGVARTAVACSGRQVGVAAGSSCGVPLRRRLRTPVCQQPQLQTEGARPQKRPAAAAEQQQTGQQQQTPKHQQGSPTPQRAMPKQPQQQQQTVTPAVPNSGPALLSGEAAVSTCNRDCSRESRRSRRASSSVAGQSEEAIDIEAIAYACEIGTTRTTSPHTTPQQRLLLGRAVNFTPPTEEARAETSVTSAGASVRDAASPPVGDAGRARAYRDDLSGGLLPSSAGRRMAAAAFFGATDDAAGVAAPVDDDIAADATVGFAAGAVAGADAVTTDGGAAGCSSHVAAVPAAAVKKGSRRANETSTEGQSSLIRSRAGEQPKVPPFRRRRLTCAATDEQATITQQRALQRATEDIYDVDAAPQAAQRVSGQQAAAEQQVDAAPAANEQQYARVAAHELAAEDAPVGDLQTTAAARGGGASAACVASRNSKASNKPPRPTGLIPCLAAAAAHRAATTNATSSSGAAANRAWDTRAAGRECRAARALAKAAAIQSGRESRKSSSSPLSGHSSRLSSNGGLSNSSTSSGQQSSDSRRHQSRSGNAASNVWRRGAAQEEASRSFQTHAPRPRAAAPPDASGRINGAATARYHKNHLQLRTATLMCGRPATAGGPAATAAAAANRAPSPATARPQQPDAFHRLTSQGLRRYTSYSRQQQLQQEQRRAKCAAAAMARAARAAAEAEAASAVEDESPSVTEAAAVLPAAGRAARTAASTATTTTARAAAGGAARRPTQETGSTAAASSCLESGSPMSVFDEVIDLTEDTPSGSGAEGAAIPVEAEGIAGEVVADTLESAAETALLAEAEAVLLPAAAPLPQLDRPVASSEITCSQLSHPHSQQEQERQHEEECMQERISQEDEQQQYILVCSEEDVHEAATSPTDPHGAVATAADSSTRASISRPRSAAPAEPNYDEGIVSISTTPSSHRRNNPEAEELYSVEEDASLDPAAAPCVTAVEASRAEAETTPAAAAHRVLNGTTAAEEAVAPAEGSVPAPAASPRLLEGGRRMRSTGSNSGVRCVPPLHLGPLRSAAAERPRASSRCSRDKPSSAMYSSLSVPAAAAAGAERGYRDSAPATERETDASTAAEAPAHTEDTATCTASVPSKEVTSTSVSSGGASSSHTAATAASAPATSYPSVRTARLRPYRPPSGSPRPSNTEVSLSHRPSSSTLRTVSLSSSAPSRPPTASPGRTTNRVYTSQSSSAVAPSSAAAGSGRQRSTTKTSTAASTAASSTRRTQGTVGSGGGAPTESTTATAANAASALPQAAASSVASAAAASASLASRQTSRGSVGSSTVTQRTGTASAQDSTSSSSNRHPATSRSGASNRSSASNRGEEAAMAAHRREAANPSLSHSLRRGAAASGAQEVQRRTISRAPPPLDIPRGGDATQAQNQWVPPLTTRRLSSATVAGLPPSPSAATGTISATTSRRSSAASSSSSSNSSTSRGYAGAAATARSTGEYTPGGGSTSGWVPTWGQTLIDLGLVRAPGQPQLPSTSRRRTTAGEAVLPDEDPTRRGCLSARRPPTISESTLAEGGFATGGLAGVSASPPSASRLPQHGVAADSSCSWAVREEQHTPLTPSTTVEPPSPQNRSSVGASSSSSVVYTQRYRTVFGSGGNSASSSSSSSSSSYLDRSVVQSRYAAPTEASEARRHAIAAYQLQSSMWSRDPSAHRQRAASPLLVRSNSPTPGSPLVFDYSGSSSSSSGRSSSLSATAASTPTLRRTVPSWSLHSSQQPGYQQQQPHSSFDHYYATTAAGRGGDSGFPAGYSSTQLLQQQQHHMRRQTMTAPFSSSFATTSRPGAQTAGRESPGGIFAAAGASVVSPSHFGTGSGGRASLPPSPLLYSRLAAQGRGVAACLVDPSVAGAASSSSSSSRTSYSVSSSTLATGVYSPTSSSAQYQQQPTQPARRYSASHPLSGGRSSSSSITNSSNSTTTGNFARAHTSCLARGARRSVGSILQHQHAYDRGSTGGRVYLERSDGFPWGHVTTRATSHYPGRFSFREDSGTHGGESYHSRILQDEERRREDTLQVLIDLLPTSQFNSRRSATLSEEAKKCSICFEDYEHDDEQRRLPCTHVFHKNCIDIWLRRSLVCPMCKHDLRSAF